MVQSKVVIFDLGGVVFKYQKSEVAQLIEKGEKTFTEIPKGVEILKLVISKGYTVYAFSNWTQAALEKLKIEYPEICCLFTDMVSAHKLGHRKPRQVGYLKLLEMHNLKPEECIFIDDTQENVEVANSIGFTGIWCDSADNVHKQLVLLGIID